MPVLLENIEKPTEQDLIDLKKLLAGCEVLPEDLEASDEIQTWIYKCIDAKNLKLVGGRFNDRLVGLVLMGSDTTSTLHWIGVRDITRRRGVAYQMLILLQKQGDLIVKSGLVPPEVQGLLEKAGVH